MYGNHKQLIVLVHMPKAGGTTFTKILHSVFEDRLLVVHPLRGWPQEWPEETVRLIKERRYYYQAFSGHACFGIHELFGRPSIYLSSVRDPIDRFESYYNFVRHWKIHHHHKAAKNRSIGEFFRFLVDIEDIELFNLQCLMLCGQKSFKKARETIEENFFAVAPIGIFSDSLRYISTHFGWSIGDIPVMNKTIHNSLIREMCESDTRLLKTGNKEDQDLYNFCMDRMHSVIARQEEMGLA